MTIGLTLFAGELLRRRHQRQQKKKRTLPLPKLPKLG